MTRRRFYAPPEAFAPDTELVKLGAVKLGAEETRHLRDVLRLRAGDEAYVFDGAGREFSCHVGQVDRASATMEVIQEVEPASPESPLRLTLAIALLKGEKFDLVVQKATELGVSRLIPLITSRTDVRIKGNEDAGRKVTRWQRIALEATKQCGRAKLMNVTAPVPFGELVESSSSQDELRLMFAERNGGSLDTVCRSAAQFQLVTAVVGSEGGWTDQEIDQARTAGWQIVTLGGRILRAETAAITIAGLLQHAFGDLR
jgi:16S rRNA (uracil1498-N3)-methyltransferase